MAAPRRSVRSRPRRAQAPPDSVVACWEDDPGDPKSQPPLAPITVPVPQPVATPLPFKIAGPVPKPAVAEPGTPAFLFYGAACALRRTADFWGAILPAATKWVVGKALPVELDSGVDLNAFYTRGEGGDAPGLHFFHGSVKGRVYFSGESPDVVCHEMGHAVLDAVRPQLFNAQSIEAAAFHESFGDMTAMLSALQLPSFTEVLLRETAGTLNRSSRLSRLAEQLGAAIRVGHPDAVDPDCLRNAANAFFYRDPQTLPPSAPASQLSSEPHAFSRVFTGAFLDVLAGIFRLQSKAPSHAGLVKASRDAARLLIGAVAEAPIVPDYFSQIAAHMVHVGEGSPFNGAYRDAIKSAFVRRGILSLQASSTMAGVTPARRRSAARLKADRPSAELPLSAISAALFGLNRAGLKVHAAEEPGRLGITGAANAAAAVPRSAQSAAESYTEDLFQRGHVDLGQHTHGARSLVHPFSFKTHVIVQERGELVLKRRTFDCGFDRRWVP